MYDIMMKNRLLARDDFSNALSELCSRYNERKSKDADFAEYIECAKNMI